MAEYVPTVLLECLRIVVCTRNSNFNNDEYQKGVVEPYNRVQKIQDEIEKEGRKETVEQMMEALEMLKTVFRTKHVPLTEQLERFDEVFNNTATRDLLKDFVLPTEADITWKEEEVCN